MDIEIELKRGDIYFITAPQASVGSEMQKTRPALIVSNDKNNFFSPNVEVVYLTSAEKKKHLPTHVKLRNQTILCEGVYTVSKERIGDYVETLGNDVMRSVDAALRCSLDLGDEIQKKSEFTADYWREKFERLFDRVTRGGGGIK